MLKFQPLVTTGVAALLVVPAVTLGEDDLGSLQDALTRTGRAIEVLRKVEEQAAADEPGAVERVRSITDPAMLDGPARDARLETLRNEVNLLQVELDLLEARTFELGSRPMPEPPADAPPQTEPKGTVSTGLTPSQLASLRGVASPSLLDFADPTAEAEPERTEAPSPEVQPAEPHVAETGGYSADPLRHARTLFRAGRYEEGYALIRTLDSPDGRYLAARFLEKLGRLDEAIETLKVVVAELPEGYEAQRAKSDLEFFAWKRDFLSKLPERTEDAEAGGDAP